MTQVSRGRKIALLGSAAALTAAMAIPAAVGAQDENAKVRVLHGAGDAPAVDIYADGGLIGEALAFTEITPYLEVPGGTYQIQVVPNGATLEEGPVVIDAALTFESGTMTTVAATGSLADGIVPQVLADDPTPTGETAQVRVVHFSADAPAVDIAPDGSDALIESLEYPNDTGYLDLPGGAYDLEDPACGLDRRRLRHPRDHHHRRRQLQRLRRRRPGRWQLRRGARSRRRRGRCPRRSLQC